MYLRASGISARAFDLTHALGISMSHKWASEAYRTLADEKMEAVKKIVRKPGWIISHDNVNLPMRVFSQRLHNQSHFISATAATIWVLPKSAFQLPDDANNQLQIHRKLHSKEMFNLDEVLLMGKTTTNRIEAQYIHHVLQVLLHSRDFEDYQKKDHILFEAPQC